MYLTLIVSYLPADRGLRQNDALQLNYWLEYQQLNYSASDAYTIHIRYTYDVAMQCRVTHTW